jgi:ElaB/YqjD/DUF883 family membrane-anchored ribosome-binding protein
MKRNEFNAVVAETGQLLKSVAVAGSDKAGSLNLGIRKSLTAAGDRIAKIRDGSLGQATAAARATDEYVHGNPWRAVGIVAAFAAITGLVAGLVIARR